MPILLSCPACGTPCPIADELRGQLHTCAECGVEFLARVTELSPAEMPKPAVDALQSTRVVEWTDKDSGPQASSRSSAPSTSAPAAEADSNPKVILGDYHVLKKLGEGAMGAVYKARQLSLDRDVALKVLFSHVAKNPRSLERFCREAKAMARLDHPNIVRGYAVGEDQGKYFFAMELVRGASLQQLLTKCGRFSVGDALHITLACARALNYAHSHGLIHRDVKPDNVLIGKDGSVKLSDLGMVKLDDEELGLTQTGFGIGTPCYMPLEQARNGKAADARSDIYALGCMLYCLLTGQPPFLGASLVELVQAKEVGTFRPARRTNPEVPERLDLIIHKMTAKLPQHRHASCAEVVRDLEALGLANSSLQFLAPKSTAADTATPERARRSTKFDTDTQHQDDRRSREPEDIWYIRYRNSRGQKMQQRLTTDEVRALIADDDFDLKAQGSRKANEGYRALATYREFEALLVPRVTRAAADKGSRKLKNLYEKLSDEETGPSGGRKSRSREKVDTNPTGAKGLLELPSVLLGRVLIFFSDRAEKGFLANLPLLLVAVALLGLFGYLFAWQMGWIGY